MELKHLRCKPDTHEKIKNYCKSKGLEMWYFVDKIMDASMDKLIEEEKKIKEGK